MFETNIATDDDSMKHKRIWQGMVNKQPIAVVKLGD
jgi:hypothetical protein